MEQNRFFIWTSRINSILFLLLLAASICFVIYGMFESNKWGRRNAVEVTVEQPKGEEIEDLRLSGISKVCGNDIQFVKLNSPKKSKMLSSGGYGSNTRNLVFFVGREMESHWLFDTNKYLVDEVDQLKKVGDNCEDKETVAIYYEIRKEDTDNNGKLDENDSITIALTSPDGRKYTELDAGVTSVLDHSVDSNASVLTLLAQYNSVLMMKKYSIKTRELISEREITKIGKKL